MTEIPSALSAATSEPGGRARPRRARYNVPGQKAGIIPPAKEGEIVFQLFPDNDTLRAWGRRYHFKVKDHGPVSKKIREHFNRWNAWSVRIVVIQPPGADTPSAYFRVMQGQQERRLTQEDYLVKRDIGPDLFPFLRQVKTT